MFPCSNNASCLVFFCRLSRPSTALRCLSSCIRLERPISGPLDCWTNCSGSSELRPSFSSALPRKPIIWGTSSTKPYGTSVAGTPTKLSTRKKLERRRTSLGLLRLLALTASQRHSWSTRISVGYCTNGTACWPLRSKSAWAAANICTSGTQSVCSKQLCSNSLLLTGLAVTC